MRIAIVTETFLPSIDGIVTRLCATIEWLTEQGHDVLIIAPELGVEEFHGAKIEGVKARSFFLYKYKRFAYPSRKVKAALISFRPDIVHVVNPAFLGVAGLYYSRKLKLPLVASYHTNVPQYADYYRLPFLKPLLWLYFRTLHNQADLNLCTSLAVKQELDQRKFHHVHVWNRGVDTRRFQAGRRDPHMRSHLTSGRPDSTIVLFVGRLAAEKNIESLRPLLEASPHITLALVGDGPYREALESHFKGTSAVFCGFLHGVDLVDAYASADLFIFPSTTETLGLVLMEAMAAGLPIVAAQSAPTCEQIEHGVTGVLYDPAEQNGLKQAVQSLENKEFKSKIALQATSYVQRLNWAGPSAQLLQYYEQTLYERAMVQGGVTD